MPQSGAKSRAGPTALLTVISTPDLLPIVAKPRSRRGRGKANAAPAPTAPPVTGDVTVELSDNGLDRQQISYLNALVHVGCGRLGIEAISTIMGTERLTVETAIEPGLFRRGLVVRTGAGREVTSQGRVIVLGDSAANPVYSRRVGA